MFEQDPFHVSIHIEVSKAKSGYSGGEKIGYVQEFDIAARGFAGVAKILGDLDKAVGSIEKYKPGED